MRLGHVIYVVKDLDRAVKQWQSKGFTVEYGRTKNPMNALIYFSEGPYIELLKDGGMSLASRKIMRFFGQGEFIKRFDHWANAPEGWTSLCIEKDPGGLEDEIAYLDSVGIKGTYMKNLKRVDTKNRDLRYKCFFTHDYNMPFLMSYFNIDPKPKNFIHDNGVKGIAKVIYETDKKNAAALKYLVQDEILEVVEGENTKIKTVDYQVELKPC
ncbi:MAG: VOC family protein [Lachnospiraceae bacterium]|nr:VOC family protein [Lachnospiraceae bacterium]MBQ8950085.1 VOC family protein [Eubacterium sp.]